MQTWLVVGRERRVDLVDRPRFGGVVAGLFALLPELIPLVALDVLFNLLGILIKEIERVLAQNLLFYVLNKFEISIDISILYIQEMLHSSYGEWLATIFAICSNNSD